MSSRKVSDIPTAEFSEQTEELNDLKQLLQRLSEISYRDQLKDAQKLIDNQDLHIPSNLKQQLQERMKECSEIIESDDSQNKAKKFSSLNMTMTVIKDYFTVKQEMQCNKKSLKAR